MSRRHERRRRERPPQARPPLPLRLAAWLLPKDARDEVLGDLFEHWTGHVRHRGLPARLLWSWRQPFAALRARFRSRTAMDRAAGKPAATTASRSGAGVSWLDVKLGLRMLLKYRGLTLVAGFTLAVGIPVGIYPLHLMNATEAPLPFDGSDRVVVLRNVEASSSRRQSVPFEDFIRWRDGLTSFQSVGATTLGLSYNVISDDGRAAPVRGAEMTASAFDILRVRPLLGRTLVASDETPGAAEVVVIGEDLWASRLGSAPDVVGQAIRIGGVPHTIVGVMPAGFLFPIRAHLWMPLRLDELEEPGGGPVPAGSPRVFFGRLADGVPREQAEAELRAMGPRTEARAAEGNRPIRPEIVSLPVGLLGSEGSLGDVPEFLWLQAVALLVLVVACANVGMLVFARTATRISELAIRTALGASRRRIVSQLFIETLVLAASAAGAGLAAAEWILLPLVERFLPPQFPYWLDFGVTLRSVLWALSLAVLSAVVAGVIPALKATGKAVQRNIQRATAGRSGVRFGGGSSVLIAADVALAVTTLGFALAYSSGFTALGDHGAGPAGEFLSAELTIPISIGAQAAAIDSSAYVARVADAQRELVRRLSAEPGVRGVAMADVLPGMDHAMQWIEVEGEPPGGYNRGSDAAWAGQYFDETLGHEVAIAHVGPGFFDAFERPVLSGRGFDLSDLDEGSRAVIVNEDFVQFVLGGRNPIGQRVRYTPRAGEEPGPWYEIVGVVGRLGTYGRNSEPVAYQAMYHPLAPGALSSVRLAVGVGGDAASFAPRLRELAGQVDAAAIVSEPVPLDEVVSYTRLGLLVVMIGSGMLLGVLVALGASGIYALMSFTITERTREIGLRTALGASRGRIAAAVAKRAMIQLGIGVLLGIPFAAVPLAEWQGVGERAGDAPLVLTLALTVLVGVVSMLLIGLIACTAPTLRALRIAPTEALREGG